MLRSLGRFFQTLTVGILIACVRCYQRVLHVFIGYGSCRFRPTCSEYMIQALRLHGPFKGLALGLWRILRCHPFSRGGEDPVPLPKSMSPAAESHPPSLEGTERINHE